MSLTIWRPVARRGRSVCRQKELAALVRLLDEPGEDGLGAALLEGEAGVGKTTLWRSGIELARERSYRLAVSSPANAEADLSFAVLRDLLDPWFDEVAAGLPLPQRRALAVALLREEPEEVPAGQGSVAAALLGALRAVARDGRVLIAIDDVQWLDAASTAVLAFAIRRLGEDCVTLLLARRGEDEAPPLGLDRSWSEKRLLRVRVGPLGVGALQSLLRERLGTSFSRPVLRRVHEAAGGNPFYALELARSLMRSGSVPVRGELFVVPGSLREVVGARLGVGAPEVPGGAFGSGGVSQPVLDVLEGCVWAWGRCGDCAG